jgi:LL-diaminopimelate aminotransferase
MKSFQPAKRLEAFPEYPFSRLAKAVAKVEAETGRKVLNLGIGTPDVPPSRRYSEKFAELVQATGAQAYPGYGATKEFAEALIDWYRRRFQVAITLNELLPLNGAKDGIAHLPLALFDEGDEVLAPDPGYPSFSGPALMIGAKVVPYSLSPGNDYKIDFNELKQKISPRTRYIWVNFPSNPTGQVATLDDLRAIVTFAQQHGLFILYDNAYSEITFDGFVAPSILQIDGAADIAVEIGSFSKSHSFAGWRMGWIVGNAAIIGSLAKLKSQLDSGLSLPLQGLGAYVLNNPDTAWHDQMIASYTQRRDVIARHLQSLGLTFSLPEGSLYIWAKIPDIGQTSEEFCRQLLNDKQILLTPGTAFGDNGEGYVRASISVNIDAIKDYF